MKDKVSFVMEETGCERSEAELALELCGYDLEGAVQAVPRLFQNIVVLKGRLCVRSESLYGLWLAILNLKERSLLRARAVVSYNPAVFASELDGHWFDFEARLYACRLWVGTLQELSQEVEQLLAGYFGSPEARRFYEEGAGFEPKQLGALRDALSARLSGVVELQVERDVLDMGQFQEVRPRGSAARPASRRRRNARGPAGTLVLNILVEPSPDGFPADTLTAGDLVYAAINDPRDIAQYLGKLFGARAEGGEQVPMPLPIEAIEKHESGEVTLRVRFSAGLCGDVSIPGDLRLKAVPRPSKIPWWKKIFK